MGYVATIMLIIIIFGVVSTLALIVFQYISGQVNIVFANVLTSNTALAESQQAASNLNLFDTIIPFVTFGMCFVAFIYDVQQKQSAVLFGAGIVAMIILTYVTFYLSNAFYQIATFPQLAPYAAQDPHSIFIIAYLPIICFILTGIDIILGLTRFRNGVFQSSQNAPSW